MDVLADVHLHLKLFSIGGSIIFNLCCICCQLLIRDSFRSPYGKAEYKIFDRLREVKRPLNIALHQMEEISRMFFNPLAQFVIIIGCHKQNKQIYILDLLLNLFCVFIDQLPSESKCN